MKALFKKKNNRKFSYGDGMEEGTSAVGRQSLLEQVFSCEKGLSLYI